MCHCWKYAEVVDLSIQACSNVTLEDVALLSECCPSGYDSSLNLIVLVFVSDAVSPSHIDKALNVLDLGVVDIYWCVVFHIRIVCYEYIFNVNTLLFTNEKCSL